MVKHGWTAYEALVAGTRHGGQLIGEPDVGVLREGSRADFAVLDGDPFEDITAVRRVRAVYRAGQLAATDSGDARGVPQAVCRRREPAGAGHEPAC